MCRRMRTPMATPPLTAAILGTLPTTVIPSQRLRIVGMRWRTKRLSPPSRATMMARFTTRIRTLASCRRHLVSSEIVRGQLRVCPQCQRLFLSSRRARSDKTLHCSLRCSRLAATHRYRARQKQELKQKERERSHRRYVAKQRRKLSAKTKVERWARTHRQS